MHSLASQAPPHISAEDRREPAASFKEVVFEPPDTPYRPSFQEQLLDLVPLDQPDSEASRAVFERVLSRMLG